MARSLKLQLQYDKKTSRLLVAFLKTHPNYKYEKVLNMLGGYIFDFNFETVKQVYEFGFEWRDEMIMDALKEAQAKEKKQLKK